MKKIILITTILSAFLISCSKNEDKLNFLDKDKTKPNSSKEITKKVNASNEISSSPKSDIFKKINNASEPISGKEVNSNKDNGNKIDVSLIPIKFSIKYKNGSGENQIAVFLDLNQDFSKTFIANIPNIKNSTINVFLENGDQEAIEKIFCSSEQNQSLNSYLNGLKIDNSDRNCNKDGLDYSNKYYQDYLSQKKLPLIIFSDGNFVENATGANSDLINQYLGN